MDALKKCKLTPIELSVGVSILISLLLCQALAAAGIMLHTLSVCTAAVMCTQDGRKASWSAGINRLIGVICGGLLGIAVIAVDNAVGSAVLFAVLCCLGVMATLFLCKVVNLPVIQGRVSCMSFLLIVLVLSGSARYGYALNRLIGTAAGAIVAMLVSMLFSLRKAKAPAEV